jgi:hypothetical protein
MGFKYITGIIQHRRFSAQNQSKDHINIGGENTASNGKFALRGTILYTEGWKLSS